MFPRGINDAVTWLLQWKKVMARATRSRRKMANTTDAHSPASSLLSSTTTTPFTSPTSTTYSTEGYTTFNYSGLPSLGGYSLEDVNYTEFWVDVWNSTEASNATERLNTTVLSSGGGYCDEWEAAQHKLFQVSADPRFRTVPVETMSVTIGVPQNVVRTVYTVFLVG